MSSPQEIQQEIEHTRAQMSQDVDRLTDKVSPSRVVGRQVDNVKSRASSMRDRVMGSAGDGSGLSGAADSVGSAASSVSDAASNAPQAVRRQAQGNPLAAGLIAFGVGWLAASLAPASSAEKQVAAAAQDKAGELAGPVKDKARELGENLKEPVQESIEQVKAAATDATAEVADQAKSASEDVKAPLQQ